MFAHSGTGHDGVRQWKQWMSDALNTSFGIAPNRLIAALSTSSAADAAEPASGVASCDCTSAFTASRSSSFPASEKISCLIVCWSLFSCASRKSLSSFGILSEETCCLSCVMSEGSESETELIAQMWTRRRACKERWPEAWVRFSRRSKLGEVSN